MGLGFVGADIDEYAFGLYFILISFVGLVISIAFCVVGPEDSAETVAQHLYRRVSKTITVDASLLKGTQKWHAKRVHFIVETLIFSFCTRVRNIIRLCKGFYVSAFLIQAIVMKLILL